MTVSISYLAGAGWQFFDNNGVPLSGGKLYVYQAGTSTPVITYTSSLGNIQNSNPIILDSSGRVAEEIWLTEGFLYKFVLQNSVSAQIWEKDNIPAVNDYSELLTLLANTSNVAQGDALIGFRQSNSSGLLAGSVGKTVHQKFQEFVNVEDFIPVGTNTTTTDCSAYINAAFVASKRVAFYSGKTYLINNPVTCDHDITIEGNGATITSTNASGYVKFYGSIGSTIPITATITPGQKTITAANTFAKDDLIVIRDNTDFSFSNHRAEYKKGEAHKVQSATGSNFKIPSALFSYPSLTNLSVVKITPITVVINNLTIISPNASDYACQVQFGEQNYFTNLRVVGGSNSAFMLDRCYFSTAIECEFQNNSDVSIGNNYGISIAASHYTTVKNCILHGTRHANGLGGANQIGDVPNYRTEIDGCTMTNDTSVGLYVADIHGNAVNTTFKNNTIYGAICLGGENAYYLNNDIHSTADLPAVQLVELVGGEFILDSNTFEVNGWPTPSTYPYVVGWTNSIQTAGVNFDYNITLSNNTFGLTSNVTRLVQWFNNNANATWNLTMSNTTYRNDCVALTEIVYYANSGGRVPRWIRINDFNTHSTMVLANVKLFYQQSGSATGTRLTLPTKDVTQTITSTVPDYRVSALVSYGINYGSIVPRVTATIQNSDLTGPGYQFVVVGSVTATNCTATVTTGDTAVPIGAVYGYSVNIQAGINDFVLP